MLRFAVSENNIICVRGMYFMIRYACSADGSTNVPVVTVVLGDT